MTSLALRHDGAGMFRKAAGDVRSAASRRPRHDGRRPVQPQFMGRSGPGEDFMTEEHLSPPDAVPENPDAAPAKVRVPWSDAQVEALNGWQAAGRFHPFTCPGDKPECDGRRELVATAEGWVCRCGEYRQDWAHGFMAGGEHA